MFCPECGAEYREGFTTCADCQIDLVDTPPKEGQETETIQLETVFESTNPALIGIAKTVLDSAGIDFVAVGEKAVSVVFPGNPFLGQVQLRVEKKRAAEAEALLSEIGESETPLPDDPE